MSYKYFMFFHRAGSRRAVVFNKDLTKIVNITSLCKTLKEKYINCTDHHVYLTDRTPNLCPFVYDDNFYASYCKVAENKNVTMLNGKGKKDFRDLAKEEGNVVIYASNTQSEIYVDTVFLMESFGKFSLKSGPKGADNVPQIVRDYHYRDEALRSHPVWIDEAKDEYKKTKFYLKSDCKVSFLPELTQHSDITKFIQYTQRGGIYEINSEQGNDIIENLKKGNSLDKLKLPPQKSSDSTEPDDDTFVTDYFDFMSGAIKLPALRAKYKWEKI